MKNKNSKLAIGITILFEIILIGGLIINIISKEWKNLYLYFIAIVCITLPFIITKIANKKKIMLPSCFQPILVVFILLAQFFGEIMQFYTKFWWWDLFLHGTFGCFAAIVGFHLAEGIVIKPKEETKKRFILFTVIFAFCFTITLGTIWEIFEFLGDYFFKTDMVNGGIEDTATDLLIKMSGALVTCLIYYNKRLKSVNSYQKY